jgi:tetratricopeptide (TPR) repeat protein
MEAYRADMSRLSATVDAKRTRPGARSVGSLTPAALHDRESHMIQWLVYTELLKRAVEPMSKKLDDESRLRSAEMWSKAKQAIRESDLRVSIRLTEVDGPVAISALTRQIAHEAEQRGALHQAFTMLCALDVMREAMGELERGRVLAQRARIARKADAPEVAHDLYLAVRHLGRTTRSPELLARAYVGFGVLAQFRGNYPAARRNYASAVREADRSGIRELSRTANHGSMVVAAKAGAFAAALVHGWHAFRDAGGDADLEAEMLLNLAQLAFELGDPKAALNGFTSALARTSLDRLALPALGGAARAAAALGDVPALLAVEKRLGERLNTTVLSYPGASASLDIAMAHASVRKERSARREAQEAMRIARQHAFHELEHEAMQLLEQLNRRPKNDPAPPARDAARRPKAVKRRRLGDDAKEVLRELAALSPAESLLALPIEGSTEVVAGRGPT